MSAIEPIRWVDDHLQLLDQRALPAQERYLDYRDATSVAGAIRDMVVRGAPAIGITAAYGAALAARAIGRSGDWPAALAPALETLAASRPTAVNLFWALERVRETIADTTAGEVPAALLALAQRIHRDDIDSNRRLGDFGAALLPAGARVYTHCNTGALATGGYGTALGIIRSAHRDGRIDHVFAGETRPWWQGARLTCWELMREQIPATLCVEGAAGLMLQREGIDAVIVGADRIAANGDTANKIGTYNLAVLARFHGVRFIVAAPTTTFDLQMDDGSAIPIEQRDPREITELRGEPLAPAGCRATNPAFDVTPSALIDAIVTECGVIENPAQADIRAQFRTWGVSDRGRNA